MIAAKERYYDAVFVDMVEAVDSMGYNGKRFAKQFDAFLANLTEAELKEFCELEGDSMVSRPYGQARRSPFVV